MSPMESVVFGKHVDVTPRLRAVTEEKLERLQKFANDVRRVDVDYSTINNPRVPDAHTCEILVHLKGHLVKGHAAASDHHAAFDLALDKVEHQMRRLHDRRTSKRSVRRGANNGSAAGELALGESETDEGEVADSLAIVKSKRFVVKPMTVEEAALQMELLGHDFFLFTNADDGRAAVVYRRRDGRLGLIEAGG
jgi:putative sigma-54 modulation protein